MAGKYATIAEARAYGYQSQDDDEEVFGVVLERASRLFDRYCGLPDGYFDKVETSVAASERDFWGDGTDYLRVDPYLIATAPTIEMPTGFEEPSWIASNPLATSKRLGQNAGEFYLVRVYGDSESRFSALADRRDYFHAEFSNEIDYIGWPDGIRVSVTAKWGWERVPADVKEATLETTIAIWRNKDQGFMRAVALDTNILINDVLPPRAKLIADRYRVGKAMFA